MNILIIPKIVHNTTKVFFFLNQFKYLLIVLLNLIKILLITKYVRILYIGNI